MGDSLCDLMLLFAFRHKRSKIEPDKGILPKFLTQGQVVVRDAHKWVYLSIFPMNGYDTFHLDQDHLEKMTSVEGKGSVGAVGES